MKNKTLFHLTLAVGTYLLFLLLNAYVFKFNYTFIGVIQELVTIPVLILNAVLLGVAIKRVVANGKLKDSYLLGSSVLLLTSLTVVIGSFFFL